MTTAHSAAADAARSTAADARSAAADAAPGSTRAAARLACDPDVARAYRERVAILRAGDREDLVAAIAERAAATRRTVVETIAAAGMGHVGGDLSVTDLLTVLLQQRARHIRSGDARRSRPRPVHPVQRSLRGRALHDACLVLVLRGNRGSAHLHASVASALGGHPSGPRPFVPGVEANTGPLGHGLPVAVGCAIGARISGRGLSGGGASLATGSSRRAATGRPSCAPATSWPRPTWAPAASVDRNTLQQGDRTEATNTLEPLADKLNAFGLEVRDIDGHDIWPDPGRVLALSTAPVGRSPSWRGRSRARACRSWRTALPWHYKVPSPDQVTQALAELSRPAAGHAPTSDGAVR